MKKIFAILVLIFAVVGCEAEDFWGNEQYMRQEFANNIVSGIDYVKDTRTGNCFATYISQRERTLASVPCESVPKNLLMESYLSR